MMKETSWGVLKSEFDKPYMRTLMSFLDDEIQQGKDIFPARADWFRAMEEVPLPAVRVCIVGQDPYYGYGQAHGLSFSVQPGVSTPRSLQNIYKELAEDVGAPIPNNGNLMPWARQGVLLLNDTLTVESGLAGSHQKKGWSQFTDKALELVASENEHVVFFLWGKHAQKKGAFIDRSRHLVLDSAHPSPFAARRGFFGSKPFSKANAYFRKNGKPEIEWALPNL